MLLKQSQVAQLLETFGINTSDRTDAGETAFFTRTLETILAKTYDVKYPELKARLFIPPSNEVDPGAESYTYRQFDMYGIAKIVSNFADDLPMVDVLGKEFTAPVVSIGASYHYSIQDIRRARMSGIDLDGKRGMAARRAIETKIDLVAALGDTNTGVKGFLNAASVPIVSFVTGNWTQATAAESILTDMNTLVNSIVNTTKELFAPDTVILDNVSYQVANSKRIDPTMEKSVLKSFLENNPYITSVQQWQRCNNASAGAGRRIVAYKRDPEVLELVIPQEFEQFPPQAKNLGFSVPVHARHGGVSIRYPLAIAYMDLT